MIKPLKNISNTSFKANGLENYKNSVKDHETPKYQALARADEYMQPAKPQKKSIKERFLGILKGFNTVTGTTQGVIRGVEDGIIAGAAIGLIGKNIKVQPDMKAAQSLGEVAKGAADEVTRHAAKAAKAAAEKTAKDTLKVNNLKYNDVFKTIGGIASDLGKAVVKTVKAIPSLVMKAPVENVKTAIGLPKKFFTEYLGKNNKATAALAVVGALGMLAFRTIQGKMNANMKNADIDHATRTKH